MRVKPGIEYFLHRRVSFEIICHRFSILLMLSHPHREGLDSPKHQPAIEGRGTSSQGVQQKLNPLSQLISGGHHSTTDDITVPVEILGCGMNHQVNPVFNWS